MPEVTKCPQCGQNAVHRIDFDTSVGLVTIHACLECAHTGDAPWKQDPTFRGSVTRLVESLVMARPTKEDRVAFYHALMTQIHWNWQRYSKLPPGPARARILHAEIDKVVAKDGSSEVSCQKGCAACCYQIVAMNDDEADLLAEHVISGRVAIDIPRLKRQIGPSASDEHWNNPALVKHADRRCVFLGADNTCQVYEDRPAACRKYFVRTDPVLCDLETNPHGKVQSMCINQAEVLTSAAYNLRINAMGFLPRQLWARLKKLKGKK